MKLNQLAGIVFLGIGVVLLALAYHASKAPLDQLSNTLTGRFTDQTMWYIILGAAAAISGAVLVVFGKRL
jgi:drug/metabolite transporter (DMT)-like permease